MLDISAMASKVGAILATILYALTLLGQVDRIVINHLAETFASKADVQVVKGGLEDVNDKLDTLLENMVKHGRL